MQWFCMISEECLRTPNNQGENPSEWGWIESLARHNRVYDQMQLQAAIIPMIAW
jgi:hypothetical protein